MRSHVVLQIVTNSTNSTDGGVDKVEALHVSRARIPEIYKFPLKFFCDLKISINKTS